MFEATTGTEPEKDLGMRKTETYVAVVLLSFLLLFCGVPRENASDENDSKYLTAKVKRVIDGDTIVLENGDRVRYIGVDTPELRDSRKTVKEFAKRAKEANKKLVDREEIKIEFDVQKRDRYNRLLAYVYVDTIFVNAWLVENGFARVMTVPPNVRYADLLRELQKKAERNEVGLWSEGL